MIKIQLQRKSGDFGFESRDAEGHLITTDTSKESGGTGFGFRPMQLLLAALGSCSAIDIVMILKKQRQTINDLNISIEGEREQNVVPALWKAIVMSFMLDGEIDEDKALRACDLSVEKYCSVAETLRRAGTVISWQLTLNGKVVRS